MTMYFCTLIFILRNHVKLVNTLLVGKTALDLKYWQMCCVYSHPLLLSLSSQKRPQRSSLHRPLSQEILMRTRLKLICCWTPKIRWQTSHILSLMAGWCTAQGWPRWRADRVWLTGCMRRRAHKLPSVLLLPPWQIHQCQVNRQKNNRFISCQIDMPYLCII